MKSICMLALLYAFSITCMIDARRVFVFPYVLPDDPSPSLPSGILEIRENTDRVLYELIKWNGPHIRFHENSPNFLFQSEQDDFNIYGHRDAVSFTFKEQNLMFTCPIRHGQGSLLLRVSIQRGVFSPMLVNPRCKRVDDYTF
jgi:hypothetical protein